MTTYNTGNAIGSTDARDLLDNAQALDEAMNSSGSTWIDRRGVTRKTFRAAENAADQAEATANTAVSTMIPGHVAAVEASKNTAINTTIPGQVAAVEARKNTAINTEIPAAVALVDTAVALTAAGSASAAKVAAEAARDAAQLSAGVYATTAAGLAATVIGRYFSVPSADSAEYLTLYKNENGSAAEIKRYPSKNYFENLFATGDIAGDLAAFAIVDSQGAVAFQINTDGTAKLVDVLAENVSADSVTTPSLSTVSLFADLLSADLIAVSGDSIFPGMATESVFAVVDSDGQVAFSIDNDGTANIAALKIAGEAYVPGTVSRNGGVFSYQLNFINNFGQSLAEGSNGSITTAQEYDNIGFAGRAGSPAATYPLTVENTQVGTRGESPIYGTLGHIKALITSENGISYQQNDYQLLGCTNGWSGAPIDSLDKGTGPYNYVMSQITAGKSIAGAAGKTFCFSATTWTQGENNDAMPKDEYKEKLKQLAIDLNTDGKAITGQHNDMVMITYQCATISLANRGGVPIAQLEAANESHLIFMACPMYQFDYYDAQHIDATSAKWLGGYYGLVYKRVVVDKQDWQPLQPVGHAISGNVVDLIFNKTGLVLDTTLVPAQTNYGFSIKDSVGNSVSINSVSVLAPNRVRLTLASNPSPGWTVFYGFNSATGKGAFVGGCGNLRDSQGNQITYAAVGKPLHNWSVIFNYII